MSGSSKAKPKPELELDDDVDVGAHARRHIAEAHGLVGEPLERRVQDDEVAEHRADDEQATAAAKVA